MRAPTIAVALQLKGHFRQLKGPSVPVTGGGGGSVPLTGPSAGGSVALTWALLNCLIVGHSPGLSCIGPRGASKNIGLGRT